MINYINQPFERIITKMPENKSITGYGSKLPTQYMVLINKRKYRVYAICFSNCASHYILMNKKRVFLRDSDFTN